MRVLKERGAECRAGGEAYDYGRRRRVRLRQEQKDETTAGAEG
jgi:hypothetical protein